MGVGWCPGARPACQNGMSNARLKGGDEGQGHLPEWLGVRLPASWRHRHFCVHPPLSAPMRPPCAGLQLPASYPPAARRLPSSCCQGPEASPCLLSPAQALQHSSPTHGGSVVISGAFIAHLLCPLPPHTHTHTHTHIHTHPAPAAPTQSIRCALHVAHRHPRQHAANEPTTSACAIPPGSCPKAVPGCWWRRSR